MPNESEGSDRQYVDGLLQVYADAVNNRTEVEPGIPLTLLISGAVLTGAWIPAWEYFEGIGGGGEDDGEFNILRQLKDDTFKRAQTADASLEKSRDDWTEEERDANRPSRHIHLRNARIMSGGVNWPQTYWRVLIERVDAFHFGALAAEGQEPLTLD